MVTIIPRRQREPKKEEEHEKECPWHIGALCEFAE